MTLIMSVSGVRGIVGQTMTSALAKDMGAAFGSHLAGGCAVVGRDSRPSGEELEGALIDGLLGVGCDVIDLGLATTPGVALMIREHQAAGGIVITASHNPIEWNGIKLLAGDGIAPPPEIVEQVFQRYREKRFASVEAGRSARVRRDPSTDQRHVAAVLKLLDAEAIRRRPLRVVLDSVNGAGGPSGRLLLERLGCLVTHINAQPSGHFAHTPEPTAENLTGLCAAVKSAQADLGFAQDPDADRLAIVDDAGRYIGEEYTLALAAKQTLAHRPGPVAVNLSTSRMVDDLAAGAGRGAMVHRTPVGEAHVARAVRDRRCVLGGEGNGGVIDPRIGLVRDSLAGMGLVLSLLAEDRRPMATIVDEMPRYAMIKRKYEMDREKIAAWLGRVRRWASGGRLSDADGLRIDRPEGWVHLRPSNTEPIARLIAEAGDESAAKELAGRVEELREDLSG